MTLPETPGEGHTTLASVCLSEYEATIDGQAQDFGLEISLTYSGAFGGAMEVISDAVLLCLGRDEIYPGAVLPDIVAHGPLRHLFFIVPELWDGGLVSLEVGDREVRYLQAIGITDEEMAVVGTEGADALVTLLNGSEADLFDWSRRSVATL
ncbi:suppressor of fused domain protein [Microlunatus sp. GCM10028923]|uniref:suppressor of fused domain protein n=1 Tax=Microlunatus sp. GCM10028923 TaxID=3273400 RepID=UPI00360C63B2